MSKTEILQALAPFRDKVMGPGELETKVKILAYLAASFINESPTCVTRYRALALEAGYSEDDLRAVQTEQDHLLDATERAAVRVARELTSTCTIDDVESNLLDLFPQDALIELVAVVSLANFDNRFSNALPAVETDHEK